MLTGDSSKQWYTIQESAEFYGCSRQNIYSWVKRGVVDPTRVKRVGKIILIEREGLLAAIRHVRPKRSPATTSTSVSAD